MSAARLAPVLLSALCLSACAGGALDAVGRYPGTTHGEDPPLAALPAAAGRVVAVRRVPHPNGVSQQIVLDGPRAMAGENRIVVDALTAVGGVGSVGDLKLGPPSDTEVSAEMEVQMPGVPMRISTEVERDALGPFGYAVGTVGRLTCLYAWQYLAPSRPLSLIDAASDGGVRPMSIRVRLCRDLPAGTLVDLVRHLSVTQPGAAPSTTARPGAGGDALEAAVGSFPSLPVAPQARESAAAGAPADRRARHRTRPAAVSRAAVPRPRAAASGGAAGRGSPGTAGLPRLPLPNDVVAAPMPQRTSAAAAPRAAAVEPDAMPLPR